MRVPLLEAAPPSGEVRIRRRFATLPTELDDGSVVWLEHYLSVEVYIDAWDAALELAPTLPGWHTVYLLRLRTRARSRR